MGVKKRAKVKKTKLAPKLKLTCFDSEEVVIKDGEAEEEVRLFKFFRNEILIDSYVKGPKKFEGEPKEVRLWGDEREDFLFH